MLTVATWKIDSTDSDSDSQNNECQLPLCISEFCHIFVLILVLIITLDYSVLNSYLKVQVPMSLCSKNQLNI